MPDAGNPQALNRYSYVVNNPLKYTDPSGHCFGPLAEVCAHLALKLIVDLTIKDILEDGRFDTPSNIRYTVTTAADVWYGNPLGGYRDAVLPTVLAQTAQGAAPNLTSWLVATMNANASGGIAATLRKANAGGWEDEIAAGVGWAALVKGGGPWDFKVELEEKYRTVILGGRRSRFEDVANIHYGYVGRASSFSLEVLLRGAGVAHVAENGLLWQFRACNFDDCYDQAAIWLGAWLYDQYLGQPLTEEMFYEAMQQYGDYLSPPES